MTHAISHLTPTKPKLLDQVRARIRTKHYSYRTEEAYVHWIKRFILFHNKRHPVEMGEQEIGQFLTDLAVNQKVAASTQNQALSALIFLYKEVLHQAIGTVDNLVWAKRPKRLPTVLTPDEVRLLLAQLTGVPWLLVQLLYGAGLRQMECLRLRVHDIEFAANEIVVRDAKGGKDRVTMLPEKVKSALHEHLLRVQKQHEADVRAGCGSVYLPDALARKYRHASREWGWQYVFPASRLSIDPRSGEKRRHHLDAGVLAQKLKVAARQAGIIKRVTCHTLRHAST
jgi:integron integrase